MGKFQWNASQLEAIEYKGKSLLLSAAAGSGKTATLTERIIRMLKDPQSDADISRMLIVTFTNDAAAELKSRIAAALTDAITENPSDKRLVRQLQNLEGASISTTHSFLLNELRPYFVRLELPPDFTVGDEAVISVMKNEIMLDCVNDFFDGELECPDFQLLCDSLAGARDGENADAALLSLWEDLMRLGLEPDFLREPQNKGDFLHTGPGKNVALRMKKLSAHYANILSALALEMEKHEGLIKNAEVAHTASQMAVKLGEVADIGYEASREFLKNVSLPRLSSVKDENSHLSYEIFKEQKSKFTKDLSALYDNFFALSSAQLEFVKENTDRLRLAAYTVISEFDRRFTDAKREKGYVDFNDIERFSAALFVDEDGNPTDEGLSIAKKYDYIFIDEYQDTNLLQDRIYTAISTCGSRFMVGDVKQSVYRFRGARPDIFIKYRELYEADKTAGNAIFMSENHRSDDTVIDFSNLVSDYMFRFSETPFEEADKLRCAKENGTGGEKTEICLVEQNELVECENNEAEFVAYKISSIIGLQTLKNGEKVKAGDVAILLRTGKNAATYKAALERRGIPVKNSAAESFFNYSEVLLLLDLLVTVDNPTNDVYLAGAMKSALFGFSMNDLVSLRGKDKVPLWYSVCRYAEENEDDLALRLSAFVKKINRYRNASRSMLCDKFLYMLISDTGFSALTDNSGTGRLQKSIRKMYSHALSCASSGGRLHDFIVYLKGLMKQKDTREAEGNANAVTIITMHRSKGLEYPVCFVCDCSREFNMMGYNQSAILDADHGLFMKLHDPSGLVKCDNPLRRATILGAKEKDIEEEMRVLYVALTRAREKLIITIRCGNCTEILDNQKVREFYGATAYSIGSSKSYAPWLIDCALSNLDGTHTFTTNTEDYSLIPCPEATDTTDDCFDYAAAEAMLRKRFEYSYPDRHLSAIPTKLSVSKLKKGVLDGEEDVSSYPVPEKPLFMAGEKAPDAADIGTATHTVLQFCDFAALRRDAKAETERLCDLKFISMDTAKLVRLDELQKFAISPIVARMENAVEMHREIRFNSMVDAYKFAENEELRSILKKNNTKICVQGVVDCLFTDENGKTVLLDYKTDRLTKEELEDKTLAAKKLISRHKAQLTAYKHICAEILGKPIDETLIFSLALGDSIELTDSE